MIAELLSVFIIVIVAVCLTQNPKTPKNFPPGPFGFPIFGHLPLLTTKSYQVLAKWKETYGPIVGLRFGRNRIMVLQDIKHIRKMANMDQFLGKPKVTMMYNSFCGGDHKGVIFNQEKAWMEQRKFTIKKLGNYGPISPSAVEDLMQNQLTELLQHLQENIGNPLDIIKLPGTYLASIILSILFTNNIDKTDPELNKSVEHLGETGKPLKVISFPTFLPWLRNLFPKLTGFQECLDGLEQTRCFLRRELEKHQDTYIPNQPRDFVDAYMDEVNKTADPNSSFHPTKVEIMQILMDLFAAATDTTSAMQSWIFLYFMYYPQVQAKVQQEIDDVLGQRRPVIADRRSMPYTMAALTEATRFSNLGPFGSIRNTLEDTEFCGFDIPKNTIVLSNLYTVHFDKELWGDPENFRPERFLDENGHFVKNENLIQFSLGKRICPGENFAMDELFLFTVGIAQKFNCRPVEGAKLTLEPCDGIVITPLPHDMVVSPR